MNVRPVWRWKSFWLGVLVVCFLGWAWVRSMTHQDSVMCRLPGGREFIAVFHRGGSLQVGVHANDGYPVGFYTRSSKTDLELPWFPLPRWYERGGGLFENEHSVSDWFVMLVFLVVWGACLAWRWGRWKRSDR